MFVIIGWFSGAVKVAGPPVVGAFLCKAWAPTVAIGSVLDAAVAVGVPLFGIDADRLDDDF